MRPTPFASTILAACAALAGCGGSEDAIEVIREEDPALSRALAEAITTDPDLSGMNRANSAASLPPQDGSLPTIDNGPEVIAAARAEAVALVGGPGRMRQAPEPVGAAGSLPTDARLTAATLAAAAPGGNGGCAARARYTMHWAARMPAAFPIYPRGAVQESAGTEDANCSFRAIKFITPVPPGDVIDFYFTLASAAGYLAERILQVDGDALSGAKGDSSFALYVRRMRSGNTEVDLIIGG